MSSTSWDWFKTTLCWVWQYFNAAGNSCLSCATNHCFYFSFILSSSTGMHHESETIPVTFFCLTDVLFVEKTTRHKWLFQWIKSSSSFLQKSYKNINIVIKEFCSLTSNITHKIPYINTTTIYPLWRLDLQLVWVLVLVFYLVLSISEISAATTIEWRSMTFYLRLQTLNFVLWKTQQQHFLSRNSVTIIPQTLLWTDFIRTTFYWRNSPHENCLQLVLWLKRTCCCWDFQHSPTDCILLVWWPNFYQ